jgi:hypothetical protein
MHSGVGISLSKVTHATRSFTAQTARQNSASVDGTKALGGWSENGSFRPCYDRALPLDALLGAATFNAQKPESYFLPRGVLGKFSHFIFYFCNLTFDILQIHHKSFFNKYSHGLSKNRLPSRHALRLIQMLATFL